MFKNYIRTLPAAVQLMIFLSLWSVLKLVLLMLIPVVLNMAGIASENYNDFLTKGIFGHPYLMMVINALNSVLSFGLPALVFVYLADPAPRKYLNLEMPSRQKQVFYTIGMAIMLIPVVNVLGTWINKVDLGSLSDELDLQREQMLEQYFNSGSIGKMIMNVAAIALIPAICEEVFFRGVIQKFAHTWLKKWWLSIGVTAFIFAFAHASISQFLPIFIAGFLIGWVYYITGNLWLSILLHFLNNGLQVVLAYAASGSEDIEQQLTGNTAGLIILFLISLALLLLFVWRLNKQKSPLPESWSVVSVEDPLLPA